MGKIDRTELGAVDVVESLDERARLRAGDDAFMLATDAADDELEGQRTRSARGVDDRWRTEIRLMVMDELRIDLAESGPFVGLQADQPRRVIGLRVFHFRDEADPGAGRNALVREAFARRGDGQRPQPSGETGAPGGRGDEIVG
jgi:hypothetical protein